MKMNGSLVVAACLSVSLSSGVNALAAQDAEPAEEPQAEEVVGEEIVVTAQKREQSAQEVAIALTAYTGEDLNAVGITNSNELAEVTPNLTISHPVGEGGVPAIVMRGVGLSDFAPTQTGPVGFYVDEVFAGSGNSQVQTMFDVDRVEVLKGPQGTLYGRNTTGGAINIISRKPSGFKNGYLLFGVGNYNSVGIEAATGGPIGENASARVAITHNQTDGWTENLATGNEIDKQNTAARAMFQFDMSDSSSAHLTLHGSQIDSDAELYSAASDPDFYKGTSEFDPVLDVDTFGGSARFEWNLSDSLTLVSLTGFDTLDKHHQEDGDMLPVAIITTDYRPKTDTLSQELRLAGSHGKADWIAGVYFLDDQVDLAQTVGLLEDVPGEDLVWTYDTSQDSQTVAAFGQVDYRISEDVTLTAGLRFTQDEVEMRSSAVAMGDGVAAVFGVSPLSQYYAQAGGGPNIDANGVFRESFSDSEPSGKLGLSYRANDRVMLYGHVTRGFKSGGFNGNFVFNPNALGAFDSETLTAFEAGFKSTLAAGRAFFNGSLFMYDYEDAQIFNNATDPNFGLPIQRVVNGDVDIQGIDLDLTWQVSREFRFVAAAGYTDSEYKDNPNDLVTGPLLISGNQLQNTPELSAALMATYDFMLGDSGRSMAIQADASFRDDVFYTAGQDSLIGDDALTLLNTRVTWRSASRRFELGFWGRNLGDEEYATYSYDLRSDFGFVQYMRGQPLTYGVDFKLLW